MTDRHLTLFLITFLISPAHVLGVREDNLLTTATYDLRSNVTAESHEAGTLPAVAPLVRRSPQGDSIQCGTGFGYCANLGGCCPTGTLCCQYGFCLRPGYTCCPNQPCAPGSVCCGGGCYPQGGDCCDSSSYCGPGSHCGKNWWQVTQCYRDLTIEEARNITKNLEDKILGGSVRGRPSWQGGSLGIICAILLPLYLLP